MAETASHYGLLLDVQTEALAKRLAVARGMMALLGGKAREKVDGAYRFAIAEVSRMTRVPINVSLGTIAQNVRNALYAVAKLEDAICGLLVAAAKRQTTAPVTQAAEVA